MRSPLPTLNYLLFLLGCMISSAFRNLHFFADTDPALEFPEWISLTDNVIDMLFHSMLAVFDECSAP
jgi:hypothetical protein